MTFVGQALPLTVADPTWQLAASADVNQDGSADLIWRNSVAGQNVSWYMSGATPVGTRGCLRLPAEWGLMAALDTDDDGATEPIWAQHVDW